MNKTPKPGNGLRYSRVLQRWDGQLAASIEDFETQEDGAAHVLSHSLGKAAHALFRPAMAPFITG